MMKKLLKQGIQAYLKWFMVYVDVHLIHHRLNVLGQRLHGTILDVGAGTKPYRYHFAVDRYIAANALPYYLPAPPADIVASTDVWVNGRLPLPFKDEAFDGIVCFQVLSVIDDPDCFFQELARILKGGAQLLLTTNFLYPKWADDDRFRHTDTCLRSLAGKNGFDMTEVEGLGGCLTTLHCLAMRLIRDAPARILNEANPLLKVCRTVAYIASLVSLPAWAVAAWIVFLIDRRRKDDFTFTMNLLMVARRKG